MLSRCYSISECTLSYHSLTTLLHTPHTHSLTRTHTHTHFVSLSLTFTFTFTLTLSYHTPYLLALTFSLSLSRAFTKEGKAETVLTPVYWN